MHNLRRCANVYNLMRRQMKMRGYMIFLFLVLEESMNISIKNLGGEDTVGLLRGMIAVPEHVLSVILARGGIIESVAQDADLYVSCAAATLVPHFKPYISKHHSRYNLIGKMKREGIRTPIITVFLPYWVGFRMMDRNVE